MTEIAQMSLSLFLAVILGGVVGWERESQGRWAGLRTHMVVSLASAMFIIIAQEKNTDLGKVMEGIIGGIGFIGAGTILKLTDRLQVQGLTTASSIWLAAAIGIAAGAQVYLLAIVGTGLSIIILTLGWQLEKQWKSGPHSVHSATNDKTDPSAQSQERGQE
jgi:putative Mg2+ transporter-C (MgtC) family protein